ncbi:MAG: nucleoside deaminase [Kiritimatiellae bacterium]|nr:nucleoside deaminase [Kiritimatiellia bacterium]
METQIHQHYMEMALRQAQKAADAGEVPTGCVIMYMGNAEKQEPPRLIASAHNQTELLKDPTAHAEMIAITQAASALENWRLLNTVLYVTKEPCSMCAGAIVLARIPIVVYGVSDPLRGGISAFNLLDQPNLNHKSRVIGGVLEHECRDMLQNFFKTRRNKTQITNKN